MSKVRGAVALAAIALGATACGPVVLVAVIGAGVAGVGAGTRSSGGSGGGGRGGFVSATPSPEPPIPQPSPSAPPPPSPSPSPSPSASPTPAPPGISSFSPLEAVAGVTVIVTGHGFAAATGVDFGGAAATFVVVGDSIIHAVVPPTAAAGPIDVAIPGGVLTSSASFFPVPTIESFSPTSGSSGTVVTIAGANLLGATAVSFGGVAAASFVVDSATQIRATVGAGASGSVAVAVSGFVARTGGPTDVTKVYPVGDVPWHLATADLDGDGIPDLVVADYFGDEISVLLGKGGGTFAPATSYAAGQGPTGVMVADVNGDGKLDVIAVDHGNLTGPGVSVLLGAGSGSLLSAQTYAGAAGPFSAALADLNGDGYLDVAVASYEDSTVVLFMGDGHGAFAPSPTKLASGADPHAIAVADLNGDGLPDILTANQLGESISVFLATGGGSFGGAATYPCGSMFASSLAIGDVNEDGVPDVVVGSQTGTDAATFLGKGGGAFNAAKLTKVGSSSPDAVTLADLDGDGHLDLIVALRNADAIAWLAGKGDGTFGASGRGATISVGVQPQYVLAADLDGDGVPDLAVANGGDATVSVLLSAPGGAFTYH